jgi:release factor glutamine methyltransferase
MSTVSGQALYEWRQWAIELALAGEVDPSEVDWFLQGLTPLSALSLKLGEYRQQPSIAIKGSLADFSVKWQQRVQSRVPVQYLTGETPWRNFSLAVSPAVLIPRPETELIIDIARQLVETSPIADKLRCGHWADLGTGSGAITLGIAQQFPTATVHAVDISEEALAVAQQNAQQNQLTSRIVFHLGSWLSPLAHLKGQLSAIISNPPYIPTQTILTLEPEVTNHEPHLALDGGPDGLSSLKTLIAEGTAYLCPGGILLTELMAGQAPAVAQLLTQSDYTNIAIHNDLANIQRFVSARKVL